MQIKEDSILRESVIERLLRVENFSKVKFPDSYKKFIQEYNIGIPVTNSFSLNKHSYSIERFLGFVNDYKTSALGDYDIAVVLSQIDTRLTSNPDLVGDEMIPIACLFTGDYVCLDYRENKDEPCISLWDHEESDEFEPVTYKISDDFSSFIDMLF